MSLGFVAFCRVFPATASAAPAQQHVLNTIDNASQLMYSLADISTAAAASDTATAAVDTATHTAQRYTGWFSTLSDYLETVLGYLQV